MRLQFIGAAHEVTGSCHYMQIGKTHMLVDCGMEQGVNTFENCELPVEESLIDFVLLTHAHVDHSGMLPRLYARGFRGKIYATEATADLCGIMLRDCAHIQMQEAEWKNRKAKRSANVEPHEPLYTMEDAEGAIGCIAPCPYDSVIELNENVKIRFTDIGHLLGSASIEVWAKEEEIEKKLVFSGDIGNLDQPLLRDPQPTKDADYVIMESTYGDRYHTEQKPDYVGELAKIIQETLDKGGNVVIPSFAVGRTQEMLYFIRAIKNAGLVKNHDNFPVYVDSPMAVEATSVFNQNVGSCFDEEALSLVRAGVNPISFPGLRLSITSDESKFINMDDTPKVIISASGMCDAGRIRHHLKHNLWRPECTVLFVGYQSVGTAGRMILEGAKEIKLFGESIDVRANIATLTGLSGHADKAGLIDWLLKFEKKPQRVFIVHGEDSVTMSFADCLRDEYGYDTYAPYSGTVFDPLTNRFVCEAAPVLFKKKTKVASYSGVYARLVAAGQRLMGIIKRSDGLANKDLAKFADQINSLCDKWN